MPVLEIVDSLDQVPETERDQFTEIDGKFQREVKIPDVTGLKTALKAEREAAKLAKQNLAKFKDVDPKKYAELLKLEESGLTEKERFEKTLKKREEELARIKNESELALKQAEQKLKLYHLDKEARDAALSAGVIPADIDDVLLLTERYRTLDDTGKIVVLDEEGLPTSKTLKEFYSTDFKNAKPKYYEGIPGGGGSTQSPGQNTNKKQITREAWDKLNQVERRAYVKSGGRVIDKE